MNKFNGGFTGEVHWQNNVSLKHLSNHDLNLAEVSGIQDCSDAKWKGAGIATEALIDVASPD